MIEETEIAMTEKMETASPPKRAGRPPKYKGAVAAQVKKAAASVKKSATLPAHGSMESMASSPEFTAAVAKAAAEAVSRLLEDLKTTATPSQSSDVDLMQKLALSIAELTDQGSNRKRVSPEIMSKRASAHERMIALLIGADKNGDQPEYRLLEKVLLSNILIEPFQVVGASKTPVPTEIIWCGVPNTCMVPLNDVAKAIFSEYVESIGGSVMVDTADKRPYWVSMNGLVMKGDNNSRRVIREEDQPKGQRHVSGLGDPIYDPYKGNREGKSPRDPTAEFVNVLGTIAEPARQNFQVRK